MAAIAKSGTPSVCTQTPSREHILSTIAGEAIAAGDACYLKSDGLAWLSTGASANAAAKVRGYAAAAAAVGEAVSLYFGVNWYYGAALTPGTDIYLSGSTAGALVDSASTGGTAPIGYVVDATRVHLKASGY